MASSSLVYNIMQKFTCTFLQPQMVLNNMACDAETRFLGIRMILVVFKKLTILASINFPKFCLSRIPVRWHTFLLSEFNRTTHKSV
jgi:hypothetical protein